MSKTVPVKGASTGIGGASVDAPSARGHNVYAGARRVNGMNAAAEAGPRVLPLDVTADTSMTGALEAMLHQGVSS
jgi:NADP-dependent 3-hydroxy acid dehydrogenase YdfG